MEPSGLGLDSLLLLKLGFQAPMHRQLQRGNMQESSKVARRHARLLLGGLRTCVHVCTLPRCHGTVHMCAMKVSVAPA